MKNNRFIKMFEEADAAFDGLYAEQLLELTKMSAEEFDSVSPGNDSNKTYTILMKVVEEASKRNLQQAELAEDIKELGDQAISLAKKIPSLGMILEQFNI